MSGPTAESRCPKCGNGRLNEETNSEYDFGGRTLTADVECTVCQYRWQEVYVLTYSHAIDPDTGEELQQQGPTEG